jgi:hypothetical protein
MLATFISMPRNFVCLVVEIVSAKLYINSYLAMYVSLPPPAVSPTPLLTSRSRLNARRVLRDRAANQVVNLSDLDKRNTPWRGQISPLSTTQTPVRHAFLPGTSRGIVLTILAESAVQQRPHVHTYHE